jgi:hypothetical protein
VSIDRRLFVLVDGPPAIDTTVPVDIAALAKRVITEARGA